MNGFDFYECVMLQPNTLVRRGRPSNCHLNSHGQVDRVSHDLVVWSASSQARKESFWWLYVLLILGVKCMFQAVVSGKGKVCPSRRTKVTMEILGNLC